MPAPDTAGSQLNSSAVSLLKGETEGESCSRSTRHSQAHEAGLEDWQKPRNAEQMSRSSLTISGKKSQGCSPLRTFPQSPLLFYPIRGEALSTLTLEACNPRQLTSLKPGPGLSYKIETSGWKEQVVRLVKEHIKARTVAVKPISIQIKVWYLFSSNLQPPVPYRKEMR